MRYGIAATLGLACAALCAAAALGVPGDLDPSFGGDGVVTTEAGNPVFGAGARALLVQPDGNIVAAGGSGENFVLARYRPDGLLDATFGGGGVVVTPTFGGGADSAVLYPDGRIAVAYMNVARYLPDGTLDTGFGANGQASLTFPHVLTGMAVLPDGSLLVGGVAYDTSTRPFSQDFMAAKFTPAGVLDPSFGDGGIVVTDAVGTSEGAHELLLLPDGRFLLVGYAYTLTGEESDAAVLRYLPDGALDPTFGAGGKTILDLGGPGVTEYIDDAALTDDGKIVLAGAFRQPGTPNVIALARLLPTGQPDSGFGSGGVVRGNTGEAWSVTVQEEGKLVVPLSFIAPGVGSLGAARYTATGEMDAGFGTGGIAGASVAGVGMAVAVDAAGRVLVAGNVENKLAVARYLGDETTTAFARFQAQLGLSLRNGPEDSAALLASFVPGAGSDGLDPAGEELRLSLDGDALVLPAGSFVQAGQGWVYRGRGSGEPWVVWLHRAGIRYVLVATGRSLDLGPTARTVKVGLRIGDDEGSVDVTPRVATAR